MIDFHLSELYDVETKALNQAVKRNLNRFPEDFMFQLTGSEWEVVKNELAASDTENQRSQIVTFDALTAAMHRKYLPFVFTEQGVAMLSSVLRSDRAIDVNITIMRTFVTLRQNISNYAELSARIDRIEKEMNCKFKDIHEALNYLMGHSSTPQIGFRQSQP